jgi:hypothetical protein
VDACAGGPLLLNTPVSLSRAVWESELSGDWNKVFIMNGISYGFQIIDRPCTLSDVICKNYRSCLLESRELVEAQINKEVMLGRYVKTDVRPSIVSSLGAIPKNETSIRLIHDLSRPGGGVNQFGVESSVKYSSLDDALKLIEPGSYLAKIDLKEAYRHIPIHPDCYDLTGIQWTFAGHTSPTFLYDARLPFGGSLSCFIFQSVSDAIIRMFNRRGLVAISYLDDFMIIAKSECECEFALSSLTLLVESLGLVINQDKVAQPAQQMTFLGIHIDCVKRTLSLPECKLVKLKAFLKTWTNKQKATKKELQCLVGKLNWAARVVRGGRTFLRNLINLIMKVEQAHHYVRLGVAARRDIAWWQMALVCFHGDTPFNIDMPLPSHIFATDACLRGGGAYFEDDWLYLDWDIDIPSVSSASINVLELRMILEAVRRWGPRWRGSHIRVRSDNVAAVQAINNGTTRCMELWDIVKEIFWLSIKFDFRLSALHIEGKLNILSDRISRLHELRSAVEMKFLLCGDVSAILYCKNHMTYSTYVSLQRSREDAWIS